MKLNFDFKLVNVEDNVIAVPVNAQIHEQDTYIFNKTGGEIFSLIKDCTDSRELEDKLVEKYSDVDSDMIRNVVRNFLNDLEVKGAVNL